MRLSRVVLCIPVLLLASVQASADVIEYRMAFTLTPHGSSDFIGIVDGLTMFDMTVTLDTERASGFTHGSLGGAATTLWQLGGGTSSTLSIHGSPMSAGTYETFRNGSPSLQVWDDRLQFHEWGHFLINGEMLRFGGLTVDVPGATEFFSPSARMLPFEFSASDVSAWSFVGVYSEYPGSVSYEPTLLSLSAHRVPEPSALLLIGIGAGIGAYSRRLKMMKIRRVMTD